MRMAIDNGAAGERRRAEEAETHGTLALAAAHQRANSRQSDALASRVAGAFSASA
jgi:hypothetical protein